MSRGVLMLRCWLAAVLVQCAARLDPELFKWLDEG